MNINKSIFILILLSSCSEETNYYYSSTEDLDSESSSDDGSKNKSVVEEAESDSNTSILNEMDSTSSDDSESSIGLTESSESESGSPFNDGDPLIYFSFSNNARNFAWHFEQDSFDIACTVGQGEDCHVFMDPIDGDSVLNKNIILYGEVYVDSITCWSGWVNLEEGDHDLFVEFPVLPEPIPHPKVGGWEIICDPNFKIEF